MMMSKFLIGAAGIVFALPLSAQGMQPPPVQTPRFDMPEQSAPRGDKVQTRAEVVAKVQQHFAMMDRNRDGVITADEMQAMGGHQMGRGDMAMRDGDRAMHDGARGDPNAMFDRLDTNRDGMISRDEFARGRTMRVERQVVDNGGPDGDQHPGMMKTHGMRGMGAGMLKMADTNNDGRITLQEMTAAALQQFDRADTNRDGRLTQEERMAMHEQMMQMRGRTGR